MARARCPLWRAILADDKMNPRHCILNCRRTCLGPLARRNELYKTLPPRCSRAPPAEDPAYASPILEWEFEDRAPSFIDTIRPTPEAPACAASRAAISWPRRAASIAASAISASPHPHLVEHRHFTAFDVKEIARHRTRNAARPYLIPPDKLAPNNRSCLAAQPTRCGSSRPLLPKAHAAPRVVFWLRPAAKRSYLAKAVDENERAWRSGLLEIRF